MIYPPKELIEIFKACPGAFSVCEAIALYNIVKDAPKGIYAELGTHKGKSGIITAAALKPGVFYLIDTEFTDEKWAVETAAKVHNASNGKVETEPVASLSVDFIPEHDNYAYVMVDTGDHSEELVMSELNLLKDRIVVNGFIAFHDLHNQFSGVRKGYDYMVKTGQYEPINIDWKSIFDYVRERNLEEGNNSWHEKGSEEFPKFVGAIKRIK